MDWFVVQVLTGKEEDFRTFARAMVPTWCQGEMHLPIRRLPVRRNGKVRLSDKPVFPGYLFIATDSLTPEMAGAYRRVPGFMRWLGNGAVPLPLGVDDLDVLQGLLSHGEILGISRIRYTNDMRIQVVDGPLKGLEGRIIRVDKRKQRARVCLDMYRNSFEVDFAFELIAEADKDSANHE